MAFGPSVYAFIALAVAIGAAAPTHAQTSGQTSSPGAGFDVTRYTVTLTPDIETRSVEGNEQVQLRATTDGVAQLVFSPNALTISEAMLDGKPISVSLSKNATTFLLPDPLARDQIATLTFKMSGTPARGLVSVPGGLYTSYFACDWMVCLQDAPGDKANFALDLVAPDGLTSAGVGRLAAVDPGPDGRQIHRWRSTRPYSPYLFAFALGPFAERSIKTDQGELQYLNVAGSDADLTRLFAETSAMVQFMSDKAGLPLPDDHYIQVLVPGREAQESASFSLIGLGELEREQASPATAWIIAHELAHQWWGNLVTTETWGDFWLNEGITTFMTAAWKEHRFGSEAYQAELEVARRRLQVVHELGYDKPLAWNGAYPSLTARRAVQYSKGALFLDHLRSQIGDEAFWSGLRRFTQNHAGDTVISKDFQTAMESASGHDLTSLFAEWVFGPETSTIEAAR